MKKSSLVLVAALLASPVFANEVSQPLTLAMADTSTAVKLQSPIDQAAYFGYRLDQDVKAASEEASAKVNAKVSAAIAKEVLNSVKF